MKLIKQSISGTGNGIYDEYLPNFVQALSDFEKLIRAIRKQYEKEPNDTFGNKFHLLNNWHDTYKIDLNANEFPYHMCNGFYLYDGGWNDLQLSCVFPLRFKAPTFGGGETNSMKVALVTTINMGKENMKDFFDNPNIPRHLKSTILHHLKDFYSDRIKQNYKESITYLESRVNDFQAEIDNCKNTISLNSVKIPKLKKRINVINKKLISWMEEQK